MHPLTTHNEFLRLRAHGLSLAGISRRLGVSKPTLIAWNRLARADIASRAAQDRRRLQHELTASADQELAELNRKLMALRQELFSRALRDIPTPHLETLVGQLRQRIQRLESASPNPPPHPAEPAMPPPSSPGSPPVSPLPASCSLLQPPAT